VVSIWADAIELPPLADCKKSSAEKRNNPVINIEVLEETMSYYGFGVIIINANARNLIYTKNVEI
jgi:hypothetical protein